MTPSTTTPAIQATVEAALMEHCFRGTVEGPGVRALICWCRGEFAGAAAFAAHQAEQVTAAITADAQAPASPTAGSAAAVAPSAERERAARFAARFDSVCPACRQTLHEGEDASWLDEQAVHVSCAQAGGVEVFERATR